MIVRARSFTIAVYVAAFVFTGLGIYTMTSGFVAGGMLLGVGCAAWWAAGFIGGISSVITATGRAEAGGGRSKEGGCTRTRE